MTRLVSTLVLTAALVACGTSDSGGGGGSGGGEAGGPPGEPTSTTTTGSAGGDPGAGGGTGGSTEAYAIDCTAFARCAGPGDDDALRTECPAGTGCTVYPGCLTPICIAEEEACDAHCGSEAFCEVLDSDPGKLELCSAEVKGVDELTCEDLQAELDEIQACTTDDECGRVLPGTSCGCTRDLVARDDVPVDVFEAMLAAASDQGCFPSDCDCPAADGFACDDGRCTWSYVE